MRPFCQICRSPIYEGLADVEFIPDLQKTVMMSAADFESSANECDGVGLWAQLQIISQHFHLKSEAVRMAARHLCKKVVVR